MNTEADAEALRQRVGTSGTLGDNIVGQNEFFRQSQMTDKDTVERMPQMTSPGINSPEIMQ